MAITILRKFGPPKTPMKRPGEGPLPRLLFNIIAISDITSSSSTIPRKGCPRNKTIILGWSVLYDRLTISEYLYDMLSDETFWPKFVENLDSMLLLHFGHLANTAPASITPLASTPQRIL